MLLSFAGATWAVHFDEHLTKCFEKKFESCFVCLHMNEQRRREQQIVRLTDHCVAGVCGTAVNFIQAALRAITLPACTAYPVTPFNKYVNQSKGHFD